MLCELCKIKEIEKRLQVPSGGGEQTLFVCLDCYDEYMRDYHLNTKRCSYCKRSFWEIRRSGLVGCECCYEQFQMQLRDYIRKVQHL